MMDQETYRQAEIDRERRDRPSGMYSLLDSSLCQECGSTDGMHAQSTQALVTLPPMPGELIHFLFGDHEAIYFSCEFCNPDGIVPTGYIKLLIVAANDVK